MNANYFLIAGSDYIQVMLPVCIMTICNDLLKLGLHQLGNASCDANSVYKCEPNKITRSQNTHTLTELQILNALNDACSHVNVT